MFTVTKDGTRLYLSAWDFNTCLVLEALEKIVKDNGGIVKKAPWIMGSNRAVGDEPRKMRGCQYIQFILDDMWYSFDICDNFLFEHHYQKKPVVNGRIRRNTYADDLSREWIYDCLFGNANEAEIKEIANQVFNLLLQAKESQIYHDKKRIQVPNTYDGGWHW